MLPALAVKEPVCLNAIPVSAHSFRKHCALLRVYALKSANFQLFGKRSIAFSVSIKQYCSEVDLKVKCSMNILAQIIYVLISFLLILKVRMLKCELLEEFTLSLHSLKR
jgi:hypothetical protein